MKDGVRRAAEMVVRLELGGEIRGYAGIVRCREEAIAKHTQAREMATALRNAAILAEIASDWHLEEVEIDGESVSTAGLARGFKALVKQFNEGEKS